MRILMVTPLYPPDIAGAAPYIKELATRLKGEHHITILTYGHIPEDIPNVTIVTIPKRDHLVKRLFRFVGTLYREIKQTDVLFAENGPSTELPVFLVRLVCNRKTVFHLYDETALTHALYSWGHRLILRMGMMSAHTVLLHREESDATPKLIPDQKKFHRSTPRPLPRPEILPFESSTHTRNEYETSWVTHIEYMNTLLRDL